jgi:hypothetical protein
MSTYRWISPTDRVERVDWKEPMVRSHEPIRASIHEPVGERFYPLHETVWRREHYRWNGHTIAVYFPGAVDPEPELVKEALRRAPR